MSDKALLIWLGLVDQKTGKLDDRLLESQLVNGMFESLAEDGRYPDEFVDLLRDQTIAKIAAQKSKGERRKSMIRWGKVLSYGLQVLWAVHEVVMGKSEQLEIPFVSMGITYLLWRQVDQAQIDPAYRLIAHTVLVDETLKRSFIEPEIRKTTEPELLARIALKQSEMGEEYIQMTRSIQDMIGALMDQGVSKHRLKKLLRYTWHRPFKKNFGEAEKSTTNLYQAKLAFFKEYWGNLVMSAGKEGNGNLEGKEWKEYIRQRETAMIVEARKIRINLAMEVLSKG